MNDLGDWVRGETWHGEIHEKPPVTSWDESGDRSGGTEIDSGMRERERAGDERRERDCGASPTAVP